VPRSTAITETGLEGHAPPLDPLGKEPRGSVSATESPGHAAMRLAKVETLLLNAYDLIEID
jgi:hypothetical protein